MPGLLDMFSSDDPSTQQGLLAAAAQMLQASGPSLMPHSFGQVMGAGIGGFQQGQQLAQQQALRGLQMKEVQMGLDQQQAALDMQNRIRQRSLADAQGLTPPAQQPAAAVGNPTSPSPPMASAMPGGSMSPKTGGPDWLQDWQASQPTDTAAAPAVTAPASPSASMLGGGNLTQTVVARLTRQAQIHAEEGDMDGANKLYEQATKFMPEVNKIEVGMSNGKPVNVITYKDGHQEVSQFAPKPDIHFADDGQHTAIPVDGYTGQSMGPGIVRQATPDAVLQNRQTAARLAFDKEQAAAGPDVDPKQVENVAQLISAGRMAPLGSMAMRSPFGAAVMSRVAELNPDYNGIDYGTNAKAAKDFATGKQGNAVRSFNVSLSHLDTLGQLADAMGNGNTQAFNKLGNLYATQTGNPAPTNFEAAKKIVTDEIVKAITGGGGGVHDRDAAAATIAAASSPAQLKGVIKTYQDLMVGQLGGLEQQYRTSTKRNDFANMLSPQAQALYQAHQPAQQGVAPASTPTAAGAKTITLSDIAATARASGRTTAEVTAAARAKGYTITGG